jgi:hypothetical protein
MITFEDQRIQQKKAQKKSVTMFLKPYFSYCCLRFFILRL